MCNETEGQRPKAGGGSGVTKIKLGGGNALTCFNSPGGHFKTGFGFSLPRNIKEKKKGASSGQTSPSAAQKCLAIATTAHCLSIIPGYLNA